MAILDWFGRLPTTRAIREESEREARRLEKERRGKLLHVYSLQLETEARAIRQEVLTLMASRNVRPEVAILALADVVALNAASTDLDRGGPRSLQDRLDSFCKRVVETYDRSLPEMSKRRTRARDGVTLTGAV